MCAGNGCAKHRTSHERTLKPAFTLQARNPTHLNVQTPNPSSCLTLEDPANPTLHLLLVLSLRLLGVGPLMRNCTFRSQKTQGQSTQPAKHSCPKSVVTSTLRNRDASCLAGCRLLPLAIPPTSSSQSLQIASFRLWAACSRLPGLRGVWLRFAGSAHVMQGDSADVRHRQGNP